MDRRGPFRASNPRRFLPNLFFLRCSKLLAQVLLMERNILVRAHYTFDHHSFCCLRVNTAIFNVATLASSFSQSCRRWSTPQHIRCVHIYRRQTYRSLCSSKVKNPEIRTSDPGTHHQMPPDVVLARSAKSASGVFRCLTGPCL